ncbi:MAG TPA: hypothetical protein VLM43_04410 [Desulfobacterales bacterium]|nr:hypothetical protein [Desulfobacterales bacterium]
MKNKFIWSIFTLLGLVVAGVAIPAGSQASEAGCPTFNQQVIKTICTPAETTTVYNNQDAATSDGPNYYAERISLRCDYPQSIGNNNNGTHVSFVASVLDEDGYVSPAAGIGMFSISGNAQYGELTEEEVRQCISEIYTACKTLNGCKVLHSSSP